MLGQAKLEDVFKSTQENMQQSPGSERVIILIVCIAALVLLLLALHHYRRRQAVPKPVNHHGRLVREVARVLPLKSSALRQLDQLADEQSLSSPLVLLLCPSLLAKASAGKPPEQRKLAADLIKRMSEPVK